MAINMSYCQMENTGAALRECLNDLVERIDPYLDDQPINFEGFPVDEEEEYEEGDLGPLNRYERQGVLSILESVKEIAQAAGDETNGIDKMIEYARSKA